MAGYAKSWVDKFNDSWYVGLKLAERGMWDQMFTYAKLMGDNSRIFVRNMQQLGSIFGCDGRTAYKIVTKFQNAGKVKITENEDGFEIFIVKYKYWQHDKEVKVPQKRNKKPAKMSTNCNTTEPDQTKPDNTSDKSDHTRFVEFFCNEYQEAFGIKYDFKRAKDGKLVKDLLGNFDYDQLCAMTLDYFNLDDDFIAGKTGYTIGMLSQKSNMLAARRRETVREKTPEELEVERLNQEFKEYQKNAGKGQNT